MSISINVFLSKVNSFMPERFAYAMLYEVYDYGINNSVFKASPLEKHPGGF